MRRDEKMIAALLERRGSNLTLKTWTPTRRSSEDWNYALMGRHPIYDTRFAEQCGADANCQGRGCSSCQRRIRGRGGFRREDKQERNTLIMAAVGMGRAGNLWVPIPAKEREAAVLAAVKLAVEFGGDINALGLDGRTALDGANQLRMPSVVAFLTEKGAKGTAPAGGRGGRGGQPPTAPAK
jgi:hypothetical protein